MHFLAITYFLSNGVWEIISRFADVGYKGRPGSLISQDPQSLNSGLTFYVFTREKPANRISQDPNHFDASHSMFLQSLWLKGSFNTPNPSKMLSGRLII